MGGKRERERKMRREGLDKEVCLYIYRVYTATRSEFKGGLYCILHKDM